MPFDKRISVVKPCTSLLFTNWDKLEHSRTLFNFTLMQYCIYHKSFSVFFFPSILCLGHLTLQWLYFSCSQQNFWPKPENCENSTTFHRAFLENLGITAWHMGRLFWDLSIVFCKGCFIWDGLWTFIPCRGWLVGVRFKGDSGSLGIVLTPPRVLKFIPLFLVDLQ